MANEWMLETIWNIFIQAPLLVLSQIGEIFKSIIGIDVISSFGSGSKFNIFYIYAPLVLLAFTVCIFLVFHKILKSKIDDAVEMRNNTISSIKYLFINLLLVFIIPIFVFAIGIGLSLLASELLNVFIKNGITSDFYNSLAKQLYWIGYISDNPPINFELPGLNTFVPPSNLDPILGSEFYQNRDWNFFIEILSVFATFIFPFYLCISFIQKIIEIFILCIFSPFIMINNMIDDGAKFKAMLFQTLRKSIIVIWIVFSFILFQLFATLLSSWLNENSDINTKGVIYLLSIIAIVVGLYLSNFYIAKKMNQKIGFIGLYKSTKQTYLFQKELHFKKLTNSIDNDSLIKKDIESNLKATNDIKNIIYQKHNLNHKKLSKINIFNSEVKND